MNPPGPNRKIRVAIFMIPVYPGKIEPCIANIIKFWVLKMKTGNEKYE
jgi:hypothetical protein